LKIFSNNKYKLTISNIGEDQNAIIFLNEAIMKHAIIEGGLGMNFECNSKNNKMEREINEGHREGKLATRIETETAKLPSDVFLWAAIGSMAVSMSLHIAGKKHKSLFFGQWAAPFLLFGIYNKLVKQLGHDKYNQY
jgi:hypothetical protein